MASQKTNPAATDKVALVLSGGGAYAAYEIGAMRAILGGETVATAHQPIQPDIYTGTSAGALNAALMAGHTCNDARAAVREAERVWLEDVAGATAITDNGVLHLRMNPMSLMNPSLALDPIAPLKQFGQDAIAISESMLRHGAEFLASAGTMVSRALGMVDIGSLIASFPLRETLRKVVDLEGIQKSGALLRIAATNWTSGELEVFGNKDFVGEDGYAAVQASTAIPGVFPPVTLRGATYVDGGLLMNTPMKPAIDCGASHIHIIYVDPDLSAIPVTRLQSTFAMLDRSLAITFAARTNHDIANARWINEGILLSRRNHPVEEHTEHEQKTANRTASRMHARAAKNDPHRLLTVHRYHPKQDLGGGSGLLDFSKTNIRKLIDKGYEETLKHDCVESGCLLPG